MDTVYLIASGLYAALLAGDALLALNTPLRQVVGEGKKDPRAPMLNRTIVWGVTLVTYLLLGLGLDVVIRWFNYGICCGTLTLSIVDNESGYAKYSKNALTAAIHIALVLWTGAAARLYATQALTSLSIGIFIVSTVIFVLYYFILRRAVMEATGKGLSRRSNIFLASWWAYVVLEAIALYGTYNPVYLALGFVAADGFTKVYFYLG